MSDKSLITDKREIKRFLTNGEGIFHIKDRGTGTVLTYKVSPLKGSPNGFAILYLIDRTFNYIGTIWKNKNMIKFTYSMKSYINPNSNGVFVFQDYLNLLAEDISKTICKYEFIKSQNRKEKKYVQNSD